MEWPTEEEDLYQQNILEHAKHPHNNKKLPQATLQHKESNTSCGDEITIYLVVKKNRVVEASFEGRGCALSMAAASLLTDKLHGMNLASVARLAEQDMRDLLGIKVGPARMPCVMLALKTTHRGLHPAEDVA